VNRRPGLSIFVLIDALGWQFLEGRQFLCDLLPYRVPLRTVLGYSSGAIPSILSGVPPAQHGHWNLFYFDPEGSPFRWLRHFLFLPDRVLDSRIVRKVLKEMGRRVLGLGPLFECCVSPRILSWFNWVEKRDLYAPGGISFARSIFDRLEEDRIPYCVYSYREMNDMKILEQARCDLETGKARFFFLYLSEMDMFLHMHCGDDQKLEQRLDWYAAELCDLFRLAARVDPEASFTVLSDHGMTPVKHHHDLVQEVESLGFQMPGDYLAVYDSTMARFWFHDEGASQSIRERLTSLPCGRILDANELKRLGVFFPDSRYGEVVFLLHPGWLLSRSDFNGHGWSPVGMHGYHPDDPDSDAIYLSNNEPSFAVRTISDVFQCMEEAATDR
jgi:predicted AlkP superfamily pyrophosphatase or phosphodiesterase